MVLFVSVPSVCAWCLPGGFWKMGFDWTKNISTSQYPIYTTSIQGLGLYVDVVLQSSVLPLYLPRRLQRSLSYKWLPLLFKQQWWGSGVEAESFESWYSWFLSFLPQADSWFLQNFSSKFTIHEDFWLNDFLSGNVVSFCRVSVVFKLLFPSRLGIIIRFVQVWNWTLSTRVTGETSGLSAPNARII